MLASACSISWPSTALVVNRQRNTHVGVYTPLSVLVRTWLALAAHYGEYMLRPVAVTPAMFLTTIRLWKFRNPKTKRDNAF